MKKRVNKIAVIWFSFLAVACVGLSSLAIYPYVIASGWNGELIATALIPLPVVAYALYSAWEWRYYD